MIPKIKEILYTTDLSKNSAFAFRYAIHFAKEHNGRITILHVIPSIDPAMEIPIAIQLGEQRYLELKEEKKEETTERIKARIQKFGQRELKDDPEAPDKVASIIVFEGDPVTGILDTADRLNSDLVIMGSHGKGIISHAFLGSVADKVLKRIKRPVLIVPIPEGKIDLTFEDDE